MQTLKKILIIGILVSLGTLVPGQSAYAIFSPTIATRANLIKQHILQAQAQNGSGSLLSIAETVKEQNRVRRENNQVTGTPGNAVRAQEKVNEDLRREMIARPLDSLYMIFNLISPQGSVFPTKTISNCLRDDIWLLEDLRDVVTREMIKAYMVYDTFNGDILSQDYDYLTRHINLLKNKGDRGSDIIASPMTGDRMTVNTYLFGSNDTPNYYVYSFPEEGGCPEGEFETVFTKIANSARVLYHSSLNRGSDWGSIWDMAKARAKRRAAEWIRANQMTLTLGGENGGNQSSLVNGGGWEKFAGNLQVQWRILKNMIGPVTPLFSWDLYQQTEGKTLIGDESGCVYFYPDQNRFVACNDEQLADFNTCKGNNEAAKAGLACDRYRDTRLEESYLQKLNRLQKEAEKHREKLEAAEVGFRFHTNLQRVSENNLYAVERVLFEINGEVKRGIEAVSDQAGKGLPTIADSMSIFYARHCPNKQ